VIRISVREMNAYTASQIVAKITPNPLVTIDKPTMPLMIVMITKNVNAPFRLRHPISASADGIRFSGIDFAHNKRLFLKILQ